MSEELPPIWALDKAAKAAGYADWDSMLAMRSFNAALRYSIIAHARTIAQYEQPPVDPDEEAFARVIRAWGCPHNADKIEQGTMNDEDVAAIAQFKKELGRD